MHKIIHLDEIDSTSAWARKNLANLNDFEVVSADIQTSGHGQFERRWYSSSANGGNILIFYVVNA